MGILLALPILGGLAVFQSAILARVPLLLGTADVLLLAVVAWSLQERVNSAWQWSIIGGFLASISSGLPFGILLVCYLITTGISLVVRKRVWKIPVLAMFLMTFIGTIIVHITSLATRLLSGVTIPIIEAFYLITLPSLLLNLLLAIPVYFILADIAGWVYRDEIET